MYEKALKIIKKLENNGHEAYIVGGFVRDRYLGLKSTDVDICTSAKPIEVNRHFKSAILPSKKYGAIILKDKVNSFEITTFRKEFKYDKKRRPSSTEYIKDLKEDMLRRDFTINAICIDKKGKYIDYVGGIDDLDNKIIRMIGKPKQRLKEDPLRILRAIRFATTCNFEIEDDLKKYIRKYGKFLKNLSYERKKSELDKIFFSKNASYGIDLILELNLEKHLEIPKLKDVNYTEYQIGIWAQLDVLDIYRFTCNEKALIEKINKLFYEDLYDPYVLYENGSYCATIVANIKNLDVAKITKIHQDLKITGTCDLKIDLSNISKILNRKPGAYIKTIISDLEKQIIYGNLENDKKKIKEYILYKYNN